MQKNKTFNIGGVIFLIAVIYITSYILLRDNKIPFSIHSVLSSINHCCRHWHVLSVGLLPIYVGLMVFGSGMVGVYLGSLFQRWAARKLKFKKTSQ